MNKKAIFMPLFAIFVLVTLIFAYHEQVIKDVSDQYKTIGGNQAEIVKSYNKGQEYLFNAEQTIKYSLNEATNEFIKNSGVKENCSNIWKFNSDCDPDLENNFINLFTKSLSDYGYNTKEVKIQNNSMLVSLEDFNYNSNKGSFKLEYSLPVKIKQELILDLNKIKEVKEKLKNCAINGKDLNTCTNEKATSNQDIITFTIENNKNILIFKEKLETKQANFVFKINNKDTGLKQGVF
ncbi:MAG: hypothetical protein AABW45_03630 [Nanoarchaeota archaeon]